ncbi:MAG: PQQ-binding-like beta-propeller repeat protein [Planctomycetaceae bacterium]|nr:PQQ-binding-like beta-propeller repeat protein [Planctomycetaceae bacterium]
MDLELTLTLTCPHCGFAGNQVEIEDEEDFGMRTFCNSCGQPFNVPEQSELQPPPPETTAPEPEEWNLQTPERMKWRYPVEVDEGVPAACPLLNSPAVDEDGRVYACLQNEVVALSIENDQPEVLWTFPVGLRIPGSPSLGPDGRLRVHSLDGKLYCLTRDGQLAWDALRVGDPLGSATPLGDLEGNTWVCSATGGLLKVDPAGRMDSRAFLRSPVQFNSTGIISENTLFVGGEDQFVHAIDLSQSRGRELWEESQNHGRTGWYINAALAILSDRTLIVTSRDDHLYNFALDGTERWKVKLPGQALGSPVVDADNRIYVGLTQKNRGSLVCIDSRTQRVAWSYATESPIESTPAIGGDGTLYFGDNRGTIHAVNAEGKALWTETVGVPLRSPTVIVREGRVVFGLDNGLLIALECDSPQPTAGWPKFLGTLQQSGLVLG